MAATHVARLYGEPLAELPRDLYIPPDALEVFLETFEGPLDLLLYLIRKANIDILDIPMARLTEQYLEYVELMRARNLDLAAEYLVMAAMLLEIKSRMLLPRPVRAEAAPPDPRAELVRRLLEYERIKQAAARLDALPRAQRDFAWVSIRSVGGASERLPRITLHDLQVAWQALRNHARVMQPHRVKRAELSIREHMSRILRRLRPGRYVPFAELFDLAAGIPSLVVSFLAVLELVRENAIEVVQREALAPLYVRLSDAAPHDA